MNERHQTCCERHSAELPEGCSQGRLCPERQSAEKRIQADPLGVECALPISFAGKEPPSFNWQALVLWVAVSVAAGAAVALALP